MHLPGQAMTSLLSEAYSPCRSFGLCREARWEPASGHIPRGYLGATGRPEEVELVMVFAEPGHPQPGESYGSEASARELMAACTSVAYHCFRTGQDLFHRNTRWVMDQLYPELDFDQQLRRVWLTEGRLCSIDREIGGTVDRTCARHFLSRQIGLFTNATVVAFGGKAKRYLSDLRIAHIAAYALAPPGANHKPARPSWQAAIEVIRSRRG